MVAESRPFQILSLSGGGVRGLYTITVLAELETLLAEQTGDTNYWIGKHFDLIAGTSIGGILALALANGVRARKLKEILDTNRKAIFPDEKGCFKNVKKYLKILFKGQYSPDPLRESIISVVGEDTLGEITTPVLIPTINVSTGLVQTFKTPHHPDFQRDWKEKIVDVALATSAAPVYFPPHEIRNSQYIDGGLAANSPALMAYHEATFFLHQNPSQIKLLSIGTMGQRDTLNTNSKGRHGYVNTWDKGKKIVAMSLSSTESLHNQIVKHLLDDSHVAFLDDPLTPDQATADLRLDNASDEAAKILTAQAENQAKYFSGTPFFKDLIKHEAPQATLYHGPNKSNHQEG